MGLLGSLPASPDLPALLDEESAFVSGGLSSHITILESSSDTEPTVSLLDPACTLLPGTRNCLLTWKITTCLITY